MRSTTVRKASGRRFVALAFSVLAVVASATTAVVLRAPERAGAAGTSGYWLVGTDGGVFTFGQAAFYGSTGNIPLNQPIVGTASTPSGRGYWMVASDGGIFTFGDAGFYGSMGAVPLNKPIVAMTPTKTGRGYWLVAADGGIFSFGDAGFYGSMGAVKLNKPIVDMATTPSGGGYWMAATDGGIFSFGDAEFFGSTGDIELALRIHAMSATPTGKGYWMVAGDGGIFAFGDAGFHGSAAGGAAEKRVIDMAPSATGKGYYITTSNGQVIPYGDATYFGGTDEIKLNNRIVAMTAMNANEPPVAVDDFISVDEDGSVTVDLLANDRDPDGGTLTIRSTSVPLRGSASVAGGSVLYRPAPDFNGTDSFTYTVVDDRGDSALGRVSVTVKSIDDTPEAVDDSASALEDTPVNVAVLANDVGLGDGIKTLTVGDPAKGIATVNGDRTITYRPDTNFVGNDSFEYKVTDIDDDTSTGNVTVTVLDVDDVPVANDDSATVAAGRSVTISVQDNDVSPDGVDEVRFADAAGNPTDDGRIVTGAGGTAERKDGRIVYSARRVASATDSFRYVVIDKDGDVSNVATVTVAVGGNEAPDAEDAVFSRTLEPGQSGRVDLSDATSDPEGGDLTYHIASPPVGNLQPEGGGVYVYTAPTGGQTSDSFTYYVEDEFGARSRTATVTINIAAPPPQSEPASAGVLLLPAGPLAAAAGWARRRRNRA